MKAPRGVMLIVVPPKRVDLLRILDRCEPMRVPYPALFDSRKYPLKAGGNESCNLSRIM